MPLTWQHNKVDTNHTAGFKFIDFNIYIDTDVTHFLDFNFLQSPVYFTCRCSDRSCMTRHVKYMHLQRFAHWCPYCRYGNVEKTKVRLHVVTNHREMPVAVRTDERVSQSINF